MSAFGGKADIGANRVYNRSELMPERNCDRSAQAAERIVNGTRIFKLHHDP